MRNKIIAAAAAFTLASMAAVGAFASQDGVNLLEDVPTATASPSDATSTATPDLAATETPVETATATPGSETPAATETPTATTTGTPDAGTATPTPAVTETPVPSETPEATTTPEASATPGEDEGDVHGIPDGNPSHHDDDGDGECEKGETVVKTTPSGNKVRVPCQAAGNSDHSGNRGHGHSGE